MDVNTKIEELKKQLFNIEMKIQFNKMKDSSREKIDEREELEEEKRLIKKQIAALVMEAKNSEGQIGFAFTEQIDTSKIEESNGGMKL